MYFIDINCIHRSLFVGAYLVLDHRSISLSRDPRTSLSQVSLCVIPRGHQGVPNQLRDKALLPVLALPRGFWVHLATLQRNLITPICDLIISVSAESS